MKKKKIYTNLKREKKDTIESFLLKLVAYRPAGTMLCRSVATYKDKECTRVQCEAGKARSLYELYNLILTKFPNTTYPKFCKELFKVMYVRSKTLLLCPTAKDRWVINSYPHINTVKYGPIGEHIAGYRGGHLKLYLTKQEGYDAATFLKNVGFSEDQFPEGQIKDIALIGESL